jgi:tRNA A37 threonylcarbamoyladenosine synthetase subunit TsaC/SUA5/YrdC
MRQGPLLMDVTAEFTGGCTDAPTAMLDGLTPAPTTRVLPPITTVPPRTTTAPALTTVLLRITVVRAFTLALGGVGGELAQPSLRDYGRGAVAPRCFGYGKVRYGVRPPTEAAYSSRAIK